MKKKIGRIILLIMTTALFFSCGNKVDSPKEAATNTEQQSSKSLAERTILYYLIGSDLEENSLSGTETISELCKIKNDENLNIIIMTGGSLNENIQFTRQEEENIKEFSQFYNINWETNRDF